MRQPCHAGLEILLTLLTQGFEERKRPMKAALIQHKVTVNAEYRLAARQKVMKWSRLMVIVAFLLGTASAAGTQSNDRDNPTPDQQDLTLRLALDSSAGDYAIRLGGAVGLTTAKVSTPQSSQLSDGEQAKLPPTFPQPDLIVDDITFGDQTAPGNVRVHVTNQGNAPSGECILAFSSSKPMPAGQTEQRTWTPKVPAIAAGKSAYLRFSVAPLTQTDGPWMAIVDRANTVKESNESNNGLTYAPANSGQVPASNSLPDLFIDHFELTDPEKGQVKIVVVNKGNSGAANAAACTLRLIVWEPGQFEKKEAKTVFVKVPALHTGGKATVVAVAGVPIINTKYSMFVDIGHDVTELNENNNRAEGEAGNYKP
jgi:hypothetical protein